MQAYLPSILNFTEIVREAESDGGKLSELLQTDRFNLEPNCLDRALIAATHNDSHCNIGKLYRKGSQQP